MVTDCELNLMISKSSFREMQVFSHEQKHRGTTITNLSFNSPKASLSLRWRGNGRNCTDRLDNVYLYKTIYFRVQLCKFWTRPYTLPLFCRFWAFFENIFIQTISRRKYNLPIFPEKCHCDRGTYSILQIRQFCQ